MSTNVGFRVSFLRGKRENAEGQLGTYVESWLPKVCAAMGSNLKPMDRIRRKVLLEIDFVKHTFFVVEEGDRIEDQLRTYELRTRE